MRLILREISRALLWLLLRYWPLLIVTGRSVTHHAFLVEAGVDLKSRIPREMGSLVRLYYTFSTPCLFVTCILVLISVSNFGCDVGKAGSVNSCGQWQLALNDWPQRKHWGQGETKLNVSRGASPHKNQTKSNFFGKAWKLNFSPLLHIASP